VAMTQMEGEVQVEKVQVEKAQEEEMEEDFP